MDPKRTREALEHSFLGVFNEDLKVLDGVDPVAMDLIEEAAQWAVDLFEECENCGGEGRTFHKEPMSIGHDHPCPSCKGRGFSLNRERMKAAADALWGRPVAHEEPTFSDIEAALSAFLFGDSTETRQEGT